MEEFPDAPPKDPKVAACLAFVIAAVAGSIASMAWMHWKISAEALSSVPLGMRSGGAAFVVNMPGLGLEFAAYAVGVAAFVALGSTWLWRPGTLRTWYSVGGILCLLPVIALAAARFGLVHG